MEKMTLGLEPQGKATEAPLFKFQKILKFTKTRQSLQSPSGPWCPFGPFLT